MSKEREIALKRLKQELSTEQLKLLQMVIETAELQGGYAWDGENSVWSDDVNQTLWQLAREFDKEGE